MSVPEAQQSPSMVQRNAYWEPGRCYKTLGGGYHTIFLRSLFFSFHIMIEILFTGWILPPYLTGDKYISNIDVIQPMWQISLQS